MQSRFAPAAVLVSFMLLSPASAQQLQDLNDVFGTDRSPAAGETQRPDLERVEERIVERINQFREKRGLSPLSANESLTDASEYFARYMARTNRYGHAADGLQPSERAQKAGYDYCIVLENIGYRYSSEGFTANELAKGFVRGWRKSPGHRENILDPEVTETGVGVARSDDGKYFAVQMFGRPKSAMISFRVRNAAGTPVQYTLGERTYTLPPRVTRTHSVCRPPQLQFGFMDRTLRPDDGAQLVVQRQNGQLVVNQG